VREGRFGLECNARAPAAEREILLEHQPVHCNRRTVGCDRQGNRLLCRRIDIGQQGRFVNLAPDEFLGLRDELFAR